jgi:pyruvate dehydrogenase E2 component (dihydrolipoamide acetyltransferase)
MEEGIVGKWHKAVGDPVDKDELLAEIETEKAVDELKAPEAGILRRIMFPEGSIVKVNEAIAIIADADEALPEEVPPSEPPEMQPPKAKKAEASAIGGPPVSQPEKVVKGSPAARKLAEAHGVALDEVVGTGPGGRIVRKDVQRLITAEAQIKRVPLSRTRQIIKNRLDRSMKTALHVPLTIEVDVTNAVQIVKQAKQEAENAQGLHITPTSLLVKAVATVLADHPIVNSRLANDDQIETPRDVNVGFAVAIDDGLVVPVIRNADEKSLTEVAEAIAFLSKKARRSSLSSEETTGGTFTVSNLGMFDIDLFAPIINPPESAILGVGRIVKRPVVLDETIQIRSMMTLTLVFDHRIMDGAVAAKFLQALRGYLESLGFLRQDE